MTFIAIVDAVLMASTSEIGGAERLNRVDGRLARSSYLLFVNYPPIFYFAVSEKPAVCGLSFVLCPWAPDGID
jgi:hypothetical protein